MNRPSVAVLLAVAATILFAIPASAIPIHKHIEVKRHPIVGHDPEGPVRGTELVTVTRAVDVPPLDSDQDGCPDSEDSYEGSGCNAPPAPTVAAPEESVAPSTPTTTDTSYSGGYSIPSEIVMCESGGDWGAVNSSSGAGGAYQILPSTWAQYGGSGTPQDASPEEQSAIAAEIYADSGGAAWVC